VGVGLGRAVARATGTLVAVGRALLMLGK